MPDQNDSAVCPKCREYAKVEFVSGNKFEELQRQKHDMGYANVNRVKNQ